MKKFIILTCLFALPYVGWRPGGPCEEAYQDYLKARIFGAKNFICVEDDSGESTSSFDIDEKYQKAIKQNRLILQAILNSIKED